MGDVVSTHGGGGQVMLCHGGRGGAADGRDGGMRLEDCEVVCRVDGFSSGGLWLYVSDVMAMQRAWRCGRGCASGGLNISQGLQEAQFVGPGAACAYTVRACGELICRFGLGGFGL